MTLNAVSNLDRNWPAKVVFGGVDLLAVNECLKVQGHSYGAMLQQYGLVHAGQFPFQHKPKYDDANFLHLNILERLMNVFHFPYFFIQLHEKVNLGSVQSWVPKTFPPVLLSSPPMLCTFLSPSPLLLFRKSVIPLEIPFLPLERGPKEKPKPNSKYGIYTQPINLSIYDRYSMILHRYSMIKFCSPAWVHHC